MERQLSDQWADRARRHLPGGVNSNVRLDAPSIFFDRGKGPWLWDVDGNDYVDYLLGQGPVFLGHAPNVILDAVSSATGGGMVFGAQHPLEVEAAERLCEVLQWPEMVRFGSSGTEMVQMALRLARAVTGRTKFVRFEGHYHGWLDNVLIPLTDTQLVPASAGQPRHLLDDCFLLPWNDLEELQNLLERHAEDVAAVLMEPMMFNSGAIPPRSGYLAGVRDLCDRFGALLIFDEIITGFRVAPGGASQRFGVIPDLATYGKAMAGGWPVAALAGGADLMERVGTGSVNHSGTFNANVMAAAAVTAALDYLSEAGVYEQVEKQGERLMRGLGDLAHEMFLPLRVQGLAAAFHVAFGGDVEVWDHRGVLSLDNHRYRSLAALLVEEGVWVSGRGIWYLSTSHGSSEIDTTLERAESAMKRLAASR
jgi:glutamate-1-semialdehyde 2,1-aminomutase